MNSKIVGLKIKELRGKKSIELGFKYTGAMLANELNISRSYLGDIESGRIMPSTDIIRKLATIFDVSIDYFVENNNKDNIEDNDLKRIERARAKMTPKDKEKMMKVLEASFDEYFKD